MTREPDVPTDPKTVPLKRGRHQDPQQGCCVMELSSLLAGEHFSDRPHSVCPALAGFLRGFNDHLPDSRRQGLHRWASDAIGTRDDDFAAVAREQVLINAADALAAPRRPWRPWRRSVPREAEVAGARIARAVRRRRVSQADVDELLAALYLPETGGALGPGGGSHRRLSGPPLVTA